ncbi:MAG: SRPBCC family protein [Pseudomonadota bacterium]
MFGKILGGLAILIVAVISLGFVLPDRATLEREIVVAAPQEDVFTLISDFNEWEKWSPWADMDPNATYELTGQGVGQRMSWESEMPEVGSGVQEIIALDAPNSMTTALDFGEMGRSKARFDLTPEGDGVKVVWSFESNMREGVPLHMKPMSTYFGFFMDGILGPQYEAGLENLKAAAEVG